MAQAMAPWQSSGLMQGIVPPPDEPIGVGPGPKGWAGFLDQMLAPGSGGLKMNAVTTAATAAVAAAGGTAMCGHAVQDSRSISTEAAAEVRLGQRHGDFCVVRNCACRCTRKVGSCRYKGSRGVHVGAWAVQKGCIS